MPKWLTEIRGQVPLGARIALALIPVVLFVVYWFWATAGEEVEFRRISPQALPSPWEVYNGIGTLKAQLAEHVWISFRRVGLGYAIAVGLALPLGCLMGAFGLFRSTFSSVMTIGSYLPIATLVPLTFMWWGIGEEQKVYFLAMAFFIYLLPMVVKAIDGVSDVYLRTAYTLGASRTQAVCRVLIPIAMPDIWHSMRMAFGVGWTYLVMVEVVVKEKGLGDLVGSAQRLGKYEHVYLAIILIALIAWIADLGWEYGGRALFPYRQKGR